MPPKRHHRVKKKNPLAPRAHGEDNIQSDTNVGGKMAGINKLSTFSVLSQPSTPVSSPIASADGSLENQRDEPLLGDIVDALALEVGDLSRFSDDDMLESINEVAYKEISETKFIAATDTVSIITSSCGEVTDLENLLEDQVMLFTFALDYAFDWVERVFCAWVLGCFLCVYAGVLVYVSGSHLVKMWNPLVEKEC